MGQAFFRHSCSILLFSLIAGCTVDTFKIPGANASADEKIIKGQPFLHRVIYSQSPQRIARATDLHIYIEGDGTAYRFGKLTADPTPRDPLLLQLMHMDSTPSLYVGRPCYFLPEGPLQDPHCAPHLWAQGRYHQDIVTSMISAIQQLIRPDQNITLIGHSGGGTLSVLIAALWPNAATRPQRVITLAGNLDVQRWQQHHGYSPLQLSLDPSSLPTNALEGVTQIHYVGRNDQVILPAWLNRFAKTQPNASVVVLDNVSHRRGWAAIWPAILTF